MAHKHAPQILSLISRGSGLARLPRRHKLTLVAVRKANAAAREKLKLNMKEWAKYKLEVLDETDMNSIDVLKILMMKGVRRRGL